MIAALAFGLFIGYGLVCLCELRDADVRRLRDRVDQLEHDRRRPRRWQDD